MRLNVISLQAVLGNGLVGAPGVFQPRIRGPNSTQSRRTKETPKMLEFRVQALNPKPYTPNVHEQRKSRSSMSLAYRLPLGSA